MITMSTDELVAASQAAIAGLTTASPFTQYMEAGLKLCEIPAGSKGPITPGWPTTPATAISTGYNAGVLHVLSGTAALDIDSLPEAKAWLADRGIDLQALLDAPDAVQIISGREGSAKLLFRAFLPLPSKKVVIAGKTVLEFRCATAENVSVQDVLPPSRHPSGTTYQWGGAGDWRSLPDLPASLAELWMSLVEVSPVAPVAPCEVKPMTPEVVEMVNAIDPNSTYPKWVEIGMALHREFGDAGFALWNDWSAKGAKYKPQEMAGKWKTFRDHPAGVGLGTIKHHAKAAGWKEPAPDVEALFNEQQQAQREEARRIGEGDEFDKLPEILKVDAMLKRFVFLADGSRVFDMRYPLHVLAMPDFRNATAASVTEIETGDFDRKGQKKIKKVHNANLWVSNEARLSAVSTTFKAGGDPFATDPAGRHCVNLWSGFKRPMVDGTGSADIFVDHVRWLFKDRAEEFLDWLAHIEQRPGVLPHTAWLHISSHTGTGRNAMSGILARVFAGYAATSVDLVHMLDSGFNERLSRKVLAVVDEIREGGAGQWKHAETLKQMITAESRNINVKYGRQSLEHNACRFLLFSNHRSAIPIDDTDRRIEVVISDAAPHGPDYYSKLYAAIENPEFIAAVAKWLAARDLSKFNPGRHALSTAAKAQVQTASTSEELSALREFNETYKLELVTAKRLAHEAGMSSQGATFAAFARMAADAGWVKLGRKTIGPYTRERLYARREAAEKWSRSDATGFELQLPTVDGGKVEVKEMNPVTGFASFFGANR